jgi:archaellin
MKNRGSSGIATVIILIAIMLIVVTAATVLTDETTSTSTEEQDIEQITQEVLDEICSYIQIKDEKGKYYKIDDEQKIQKIALLISPLVSQDIDMTQLTIQIDNGETVRMLYYNSNSAEIGSQSLFEHSLWDNLDIENFGLISIMDIDESITNYHVLNENSDNTYLVFKLSPDMQMSKYDTIKVTLFPSSGITRTTTLKAPMPMKSIITFE